MKICYIMQFLDMQIYITLMIWSVSAKLATKWFFSSMNPKMPFHICKIFHDFLTKWTTILTRTDVNWSILKSKISILKNFDSRFSSFNKFLFQVWVWNPCLLTMWVLTWHFWLETYGQKSHLKGFSPVWIIICLLIKVEVFMTTGQYGQLNCLGGKWRSKAMFCNELKNIKSKIVLFFQELKNLFQ